MKVVGLCRECESDTKLLQRGLQVPRQGSLEPQPGGTRQLKRKRTGMEKLAIELGIRSTRSPIQSITNNRMADEG